MKGSTPELGWICFVYYKIIAKGVLGVVRMAAASQKYFKAIIFSSEGMTG
jgi:hypothetical protein